MPPDQPDKPDPWPSTSGSDTFGSRLRRLRTLAGLSQEALAARAGLSRRGIADLERGARRWPYPDTARRLAGALGLEGAERNAFMAACRPTLAGTSGRYTLAVEPLPLVGRERELAELLELAAGTRLLTLTGVGGIGKTRLALELARRREDAYDDGAVVVDLAAVPDGAWVPDAIAAGLGLDSRRTTPALQAVEDHLRAKQLLIMLDNCEHLVEACARTADALLRNAAGLGLLITSREALRIPSETVWIVPALLPAEAVDLFLERAAGPVTSVARRGRAPSPAEVDTIEIMCRHLEGIPLAIELAAVRVPVLGVAQVADLLADRLGFLSRGNRLDPPRHQTLRAALDWSHALLGQLEQDLFARLAVFAGGWTLATAEMVSPADGPASVLDVLTGLVDKSLVLVEEVDGRRRFRFLETIREYAWERLRASGDEAAVRDRHAACLHAVAEQGAVVRLGVRYPGDVDRVRAEQANLRAALRWLQEQDRPEEGLALCWALSGFWLGQGLLREGELWWGIFLADPDRVSSRAFAEGLHARGRLAEYGGAFDRAADLYQRSRIASIEHGDPAVASRAWCGLGDVALHHGAYAEAYQLFEAALGAAQDAAADPELAQALLSLGRAAALLGEQDRARDWLERSLTIMRGLGDRWGVAYVLQLSGEQARQAGRLDEARGLLEEAHVLWRQAGTKMGERAAVMNLAAVAQQLGMPVRAADLAWHALDLGVQLDDSESATTVRALEITAQVLGALHQAATAIRLLAVASRRRTVIGAPRPAGEQPEVDELIRQARVDLGEVAFGEAWQDGEELTMPVAVESAAAALAVASTRSR